jgi:aminoglycoside/choline kinase family phosphotransferase
MEARKLTDSTAAEMRPELEILNWASDHVSAVKCLKLPGDASTRMYFRTSGAKASDPTHIVMKMENFAEQGASLPFLVMRDHLHRSGVDVPEVLKFDPARGLMLLEDLGDTTMLRRLQEVASEEIERHWYERVIDSLAEMHIKASPGPNSARFDFEKLMWEVGFTFEHFYEKYLGRVIAPQDRRMLDECFGEICGVLASEPVVFTHRDFHSRNVMVAPPRGAGPEYVASVHTDRLVMIDFQDARLGPAQYDLASLLKDSYYQLEEAQVSRLIDYYVTRVEAVSRSRIDRAQFRRVFDLMSVQRNFKAIGSFASFLNRRGNATYLKFIGNTFENIRRTLLKYPEYSSLREVLFHYYYF